MTGSNVPERAETAARPPVVHERVLVTWLAIFPLVALALWAAEPFTAGWHPVLRAFALTIVVVPTAVYLVVPRLMAGYLRLTRPRRVLRMSE